MINVEKAYAYCKEDISLIENYDAAVSDTTQLWICHHRDGVKTLPSGIRVFRSRDELKEDNRYYHCPANELIFVTQSEHQRIHHLGKVRSEDTRAKLSAAAKLQWQHQDKAEIGRRISKSLTGRKGLHWKLVDGKRVWYE